MSWPTSSRRSRRHVDFVKPTTRLLVALIGWVALGLAASFWEPFVLLWLGYGGLLGLIAVGDFLVSRYAVKPLQIERQVPGRFALDVYGEVCLTLRHPAKLTRLVEIFDGIPASAETTELPWSGEVAPHTFTKVTYPLRFLKRGRLVMGPIHVQEKSPLGLWDRRYRTAHHDDVRVYPNYEPVVRFALLAMENRENQMGIVKRARRGVSLEFQQLREYQEGDNLSQIDWKATSKRLELISREYREERDQNVILLLDCGRRMRVIDGEISQFDHCLNAMLLLSFIALRQGDHIGILSFGGTERWLPPVKGQHGMTTLLNHLYDYETSPQPSDFSEAAERLMIRQKRRALVIILTNLRSEDASQLLPSLQLIKRRHLPLVASLREASTEAQQAHPVTTFDDALAHAATQLYVEERQAVFQELRSHGILTMDEPASALPIALTNSYLEIKHAGLL